MNITFCAVRTDLEIESTCPCMGILSLAALVREETDHKVHVVLPLDYPAFYANLEHELRDCDLLGISSTSYNWYVTRELIAGARRVNPRITIVLGGIHPTFYPEYCLRSTVADIVVRGEGEVTFMVLVKTLMQGSSLDEVAGITYKTDGGKIVTKPDRPLLSEEKLDSMPLPAYDLIPPNQYGYVPFECSRGCPHNCAFCGILFPKSHRCISSSRAEALLRRLRGLPDRFYDGGVFFTDDSFGTRSRVAREILRLFSPTGFVLGIEARFNDLLRHQLLAEMEKNRFYLIQIGVEAGYQEGVDKVHKKMQIKELYRFAEQAAARNFCWAISYSMTLGLPWENEEHVLRSINFACELAVRSGSTFPFPNNFNPLPGSLIIEKPEEYGMPPLGPEFYDDGNWFRPFLGFTRIPAANRQFLLQYCEWRRQIHPAIPNLPLVQFPDGKHLANHLWEVGKVPV